LSKSKRVDNKDNAIKSFTMPTSMYEELTNFCKKNKINNKSLLVENLVNIYISSNNNNENQELLKSVDNYLNEKIKTDFKRASFSFSKTSLDALNKFLADNNISSTSKLISALVSFYLNNSSYINAIQDTVIETPSSIQADKILIPQEIYVKVENITEEAMYDRIKKNKISSVEISNMSQTTRYIQVDYEHINVSKMMLDTLMKRVDVLEKGLNRANMEIEMLKGSI
jgi:metal-responsive CopG/Arc/MetJ family transcriptional regulator